MKIQWEYDLVEKPFCEQLKVMGWQWLKGDTDVPELTERETFREVLLKDRLTAALRKLNLRGGQPWLDDVRIARAIRDLEQATGHRLMEVNQAATELLLKGTVVDGLPDWEYGRPQPVKFIDFENPANNDFLVINQFKVELTSGREWLRERVRLLSRKLGVKAERVEVRDLGYRWGSCGKNGVVYFNWKLLQLPVRVTDYVIAHELAHLLEPQHGPELWRILDRSLPAWRMRCEELKIKARDIYWCHNRMVQ